MERRKSFDTYVDTMLWIADGRRSWNRHPSKPGLESMLDVLLLCFGTGLLVNVEDRRREKSIINHGRGDRI